MPEKICFEVEELREELFGDLGSGLKVKTFGTPRFLPSH